MKRQYLKLCPLCYIFPFSQMEQKRQFPIGLAKFTLYSCVLFLRKVVHAAYLSVLVTTRGKTQPIL